MKTKRGPHPRYGQLTAGLPPFRFRGHPAVRCPMRSVARNQSGHSPNEQGKQQRPFAFRIPVPRLSGRFASYSGHWMRRLAVQHPARKGQSENFFIADVQFAMRSEPAIQSKPPGILAPTAPVQRFEPFTAPHAMGFERRLTESSCRSSGRNFIQAADRARPILLRNSKPVFRAYQDLPRGAIVEYRAITKVEIFRKITYFAGKRVFQQNR